MLVICQAYLSCSSPCPSRRSLRQTARYQLKRPERPPAPSVLHSALSAPFVANPSAPSARPQNPISHSAPLALSRIGSLKLRHPRLCLQPSRQLTGHDAVIAHARVLFG